MNFLPILCLMAWGFKISLFSIVAIHWHTRIAFIRYTYIIQHPGFLYVLETWIILEADRRCIDALEVTPPCLLDGKMDPLFNHIAKIGVQSAKKLLMMDFSRILKYIGYDTRAKNMQFLLVQGESKGTTGWRRSLLVRRTDTKDLFDEQ